MIAAVRKQSRPTDLNIDLISGHWQDGENPIGFDDLKTDLLGLQKASDKILDINISEWNSDHKKRAQRLHRTCSRDCVFIVVGFSHGVGRGVVEFANELWECARNVHRVYSVDGVYWHRFLKWRAVWSPFVEPVITMPDNVLKVDVYRQNNDIPRGHRIESPIPGRIHNRPYVNPYDATDIREFWPWSHAAMDEVKDIHEDVYRCVENYMLAS